MRDVWMSILGPRTPDRPITPKMSTSQIRPVFSIVSSGFWVSGLGFRDPSWQVFDKFLLNPNWTSKMAWDFFVMFLVVMDSIILPFQLAFKYGMPDDGFDEVWFWVTTIVFFTDVGLSFNTAIENKHNPGHWILSRRRIACLYLYLPWEFFPFLFM